MSERNGWRGTAGMGEEGDGLQVAAVRMISRAQWFLMSLPMMYSREIASLAKALNPAERNECVAGWCYCSAMAMMFDGWSFFFLVGRLKIYAVQRRSYHRSEYVIAGLG